MTVIDLLKYKESLEPRIDPISEQRIKQAQQVDFGERLQQISASMRKINNLMVELKKMSDRK